MTYHNSTQLYTSANSLARTVSNILDERIKKYEITTSYALLMLAVFEEPGIGQKEICDKYNLAPSTVTRFIDKLVNKGWLERKSEGREVIPVLTKEGKSICPSLNREFEALDREIEENLGEKFMDTLNRMMEHGTDLLKEE